MSGKPPRDSLKYRVDQSTGTITMTQTHYIEEILRRRGMTNRKLYDTPMQQRLTSPRFLIPPNVFNIKARWGNSTTSRAGLVRYRSSLL